jgi:very-short-patch-repair endonuclease/RecA/RadA recombinase
VTTDAVGDVWLEGEWERCRSALVDLTRRNRLLHVGHGGRNSLVRIVAAGPDRILGALLDGRKLNFGPLPDPNGVLSDEQTGHFNGALAAARLTDADFRQTLEGIAPDAPDAASREAAAERALADRVRAQLGMPTRPGRRQQTDLTAWANAQGIDPSLEPDAEAGGNPPVLQTLLLPQSQEARLARLARQVVAIESETGVSTLHLAFGFLEWQENKNAAESFVSPLILLPVALSPLTVGGVRTYALVAQDTEAKENIALRLRLKQDEKIELPPLPVEGVVVEDYVAAVRSAVSTRPGWRVRRWMTLAPFSFARIAMYEDLDPTRWGQRPIGFPLVRDVLFGKDDGSSTTTIFAETHDVDDPQVAAVAPILVTDADSSQHSALIDVMRGRNLVIEGPPGTGKSQTIVNIIANALHGGKTVLFVSEKMAALDVVKARLDEAGLGEFCLSLHAAGSRPASVIEALRRRRALRQPAQPPGIHPADRARQAAARLDAHRRVLAMRIGPHSDPVYDMIGKLCDIERRRPQLAALLRRAVGSVRGSVSGASHGAAKGHLRTLEDSARRSDLPGWNPLHSPWNALARSDLRNDEQRELIATLERLAAVADALADPETGSATCLPEVRASLRHIAALTPPAADIPGSLLAAMAPPTAARDLQRDAEAAIRRKEAKQALVTAGIAAERFGSALLDNLVALQRKLGLAGLAVGDVAARAEEAAAGLIGFETEQSTIEDIARLCGLGSTAALRDVLAGCEAAALASRVEDSWLAFRHPDRLGQRAELETLRTCLHKALEDLASAPVDASELAPQAARQLAEALRRRGLLASMHRDVRHARAEFRRRWRTGRPPRRRKAAFIIDGVAHALEQIATVTSAPHLVDGTDNPARTLEALIAAAAWQQEAAVAVPSLANRLVSMAPDDLRALGHLAVPACRLAALMSQAGLAANRSWRPAIAELRGKVEGLRELTLACGVLGLRADFPLDGLCDLLAARQTLAQTDCLSEAPTAPVIAKHGAEMVRRAATFALDVHALLPRCAPQLLTGDWPEEEARLRAAAKLAGDHVDEMDTAIEALLTLGLGDFAAAATQVEAASVAANARALHAAGDELSAWLAFATERDACRADTLGRLIFDAVAGQSQILTGLEDALDWLVATAALREVDVDALRATRVALDRYRADFQSADSDRLRRDRKDVVAAALHRPIPNGIGSGPRKNWTEAALVEHQMGLQQRHAPLRDLLRRARGAVTAMTPCLMMSPLTVAQFLDPRGPKFNLLVMDEASQIRPESALGALLRAEQAIVVGDSNQLPPTSFFDRAVADGDDDDADGGAEESILEKVRPRWRPARSLIWHYRSRHESLIRFSNRHFYDDRLVLFPAPQSPGPHLGVEVVTLNGTWQDRRNVVEAAAIVRAAQRWMRERPDLSLGLVAMNGPQRDYIQAEFDRLAAEDLTTRDYLDIWRDRHEPFFVKNLENVQGDERDAVFVSLGWGRNEQGVIHQRFYPLGREDGWRRLNVLFTRAKHKIVVFASLRPEDIYVDEAKTPRGVRVLRQYLEFLRDGRLDAGRADDAPADSPFEEAVAAALRETGQDVALQVGVQGYRIDIGVRHPDGTGRFVLGIECDGATYHRSASARDRDRLRQEVLERLGWRIVRVWSTEWFRDWKAELRRLEAEIAQAIELAGEPSQGGFWHEPTMVPAIEVGPSPLAAANATELSEPTSAARTAEPPNDLADRLRQFRERVIMADLPGSEPGRSILREEMIAAIVKANLDDPDDFHRKIHPDLRTRTDGRQTRYLERICELVAEG